MTAFERVTAAFEAQGLSVAYSGGNRASAQAPGHSPADRSVSITGIDGQCLIHCHAGEDTADVLAEIGLTLADLFDEPKTGARYDYPDGRRVHRTPDKQFRQSGNTKGRSLYRVDKLCDADGTVFVTEGEKDVHAIESAGGVAVCPAMGAGKSHLFDWEPLRGRRVAVVADRDEPGRKHAAQVAELLGGIAKSVKVVEAATGKDAADHIAAGKTLDQLTDFSGVPNGTRSETSNSIQQATGAQVLNEVSEFLARFVVYPSEHERIAHTLWIAHTWLMDCWDSTPRIAFLSPEPGSGKSRALEVTEPLVPRPVHAVNTTPAYLFRKVSDEDGPPTILYDEIDTVFGPKAKDNEDIRGMLNAGHRKGATAGRCVVRGKIVETEELPAYCAVALAGLDDLPDTIMTRSVVVRMRRRSADEQVEPWRPRVNGPDAVRIWDQLAAWSSTARAALVGDFWPDMPNGVEDRDADVWEALLAVADLAGGTWPAVARKAAVTAVTASKRRTPSAGVLLLRDLKVVFDNAHGYDKMPTEDILAGLARIEEAPWATVRRGEPLDARGLANRLSKYGIGSKAQRNGELVFKGYARAQFEDAWKRYLTDLPTEPPIRGDDAVTSVTEVTSATDVTAVTATNGQPGRCGCGVELTRPESLERGCCVECALTRAAS